MLNGSCLPLRVFNGLFFLFEQKIWFSFKRLLHFPKFYLDFCLLIENRITLNGELMKGNMSNNK